VHAWPVSDGRGVVGVISQAQIEQAVTKGQEDTSLGDFLDVSEFPHVHADHPLYVALERVGTAKLDVLPVVSRADVHQLLGIVVLPDVLNAFGVDPRDPGDPAPLGDS
ncbi:MAG: CBS domain-containing protein, partial [Candidatus Acidiferrales bacterium]